MRKSRLFWLIPILVLLYILIGSFTFNSGKLISEGFPLEQKWATNLKDTVVGLSTNGNQIIFAVTTRRVFALDAVSGEKMWSHELAWHSGDSLAIEANGIVYIADSKKIWAFDQMDGRIIWQQRAHDSEAVVSSVANNVVAVEEAGSVYVYDAASGQLLWDRGACRNFHHANLYNRVVYIPCNSILAVDILSGEDIYEIEVPARIFNKAYKDRVMYYSPKQNEVAAFDLQNRSEVWRIPFRGEACCQFKVLGEYLSIIDGDQSCIFQRESGRRLWCADFIGQQSPTALRDKLYLFNFYYNEITAYELINGKPIGSLAIKKLEIASVQRELMTSIGDTLAFGSGYRVIAFSE